MSIRRRRLVGGASGEPRPREDHLFEPLFGALREAAPRERRRGLERRFVWLLIAACAAGLLLTAWLA